MSLQDPWGIDSRMSAEEIMAMIEGRPRPHVYVDRPGRLKDRGFRPLEDAQAVVDEDS